MSVLFLEAITPWLVASARAMASEVPVKALQHVSITAGRRITAPDGLSGDMFRAETRRFPPGFAGKLAPLFAPLIRSRIKRELARLSPDAGMLPQVICPYPYCEPWVRGVPDGQLVYYNLDDYTQYAWADRAQVIAREDALIARAHVTICLSIHQVEDFRRRHPAAGSRIHHLPLGIDAAMLNPQPEDPPRAGVVGYVGNLTDRVDWAFVDAVAALAPDLTFEFVGNAAPSDADWAKLRDQAFARENVRHLGPVPQSEVAPHYWHSAVNWMPYDTGHPFNIASSPTKIFDAFGAGRPFVSTALPEVACYPDRIMVATSPQDAAEILRAEAASHDPAKARELRDFAGGHVWQRRAEDMLRLLGRMGHGD